MAKTFLITVNDKARNYGITSGVLAAVPPNIQLGLLEAHMSSKGIDTELIDSDVDGLTVEEVIQKLLDEAPELVGVIACGANPSASTMSMVGVIKFFKLLRKERDVPFKTFVWGGHPTVLAERTLRETGTDFVIYGEGYESCVGVYQHITRNKPLTEIPGIAYFDSEHFVVNAMPPLVALDDLANINWDKMNPGKLRAHNWHCFGPDINNRSPYAIIWTNQGCPFPCDFCCINNVFGDRKYRFRSMQNVVAEIDELVNKYGVKHLKILDELFITKHPRLNEFCDLMEERNYDLNMWCFARTDSVNPEILKRLSRIGLNWVAYGFESIDENILKSTNKRSKANVYDTVKMTRDAGLSICADVIAGLWDDDLDSIKRTYDFMYEHDFEWVNVYPAFGYPGTPLYDNYIRQGVIEEPKKWDIYGLYSKACIPLPTKHLSSREVLRARDDIFTSYYKEPKILSMLQNKFGIETKNHVQEMVQNPLERTILQSGNEQLGYPAGGLAANGIVGEVQNHAQVV